MQKFDPDKYTMAVMALNFDIWFKKIMKFGRNWPAKRTAFLYMYVQIDRFDVCVELIVRIDGGDRT